MKLETLALGIIFAYGVIMLTAFAIVYARRRWADSPAGRQLMAVSVITAIEWFLLVLVLFGITFAWWVYACAYALGDAVITQRFMLLVRAGQAPPSE